MGQKPKAQISESVSAPLPNDDKELEAATDNPKEIRKNTDEQSEPEIHALFDPLNRNAIKLLFCQITESDWTKFFSRAARNGLKEIREENGMYNPAKIAEWLVKKGLYTREHVVRRLANNLPARNRDQKNLITGETE